MSEVLGEEAVGDQIVQGLVGRCRDFGFYTEDNEEPCMVEI